MRVFLAVIPPDEVLNHLDLAVATVRRVGGDLIRWSARENWHITAAFYGEIPDGAVEPLTGYLSDEVRKKSDYQLDLRGAGLFANRTLWVGVGGDTDAHKTIAEIAADAGTELGLYTDDRERSRAHLTIGRSRPGTRPSGRRVQAPHLGSDLVQALAVYASPTWTVSELWLMSSEPGAGRGGGSLYTHLSKIELSGHR